MKQMRERAEIGRRAREVKTTKEDDEPEWMRQMRERAEIGRRTKEIGENISTDQLKSLCMKQLTLEQRLEVGFRAMDEFEALQRKYFGVTKRMAMNSPDVRKMIDERQRNRKPMDRILDVLITYFTSKLGSTITLGEKERQVIGDEIAKILDEDEGGT